MTYPSKLTGHNPVDYYELISAAAATEGYMAVMDASGKVKNGADEADMSVIGIIKGIDSNDNIEIETGVFRIGNSSTAALARSDRGSICYLEDSETVRKTAGSHSVVAGLVVDVDSNGVWVDMTAPGLASARAAAVTGFTQMSVQVDPAECAALTSTDPAAAANDVTDSTSGSASGTHALTAIGDTSSDQSAPLNNNFATIAAEYNALKDDVEANNLSIDLLNDDAAALKTAVDANTSAIAAVIDKLQAGGFMAS